MTPKQLDLYLLAITDKRIAAAERALPCSACTICQFTTCIKAGAYRNRERLVRHIGIAPGKAKPLQL